MLPGHEIAATGLPFRGLRIGAIVGTGVGGGAAARRSSVRVQFAQHLDGGVKPFGKPFIERFVAQSVELRLAGHAVGHVGVFGFGPAIGYRHHAGGGDPLPFGQRGLGRLVQSARHLEIVGLLETAQRVFGAHAHLAVDHAGAEADTVEHDLRLHDRPFGRIGNVVRRVAVRRRAISHVARIVRRHGVGQIVAAARFVAMLATARSGGLGRGFGRSIGFLPAASDQRERGHGGEDEIAHGESS